jgi:hypothetical protein
VRILSRASSIIFILLLIMEGLAYTAKFIAWAIRGAPSYIVFPGFPVEGLTPSLGDLFMGLVLLAGLALVVLIGVVGWRVVRRVLERRRRRNFLPMPRDPGTERVYATSSEDDGDMAVVNIESEDDANVMVQSIISTSRVIRE